MTFPQALLAAVGSPFCLGINRPSPSTISHDNTSKASLDYCVTNQFCLVSEEIHLCVNSCCQTQHLNQKLMSETVQRPREFSFHNLFLCLAFKISHLKTLLIPKWGTVTWKLPQVLEKFHPLSCYGLRLGGCQCPQKPLWLPFSTGQSRKNKTKSSWVQIRERERSLTSCSHRQNRLILGKITLIYYQSKPE